MNQVLIPAAAPSRRVSPPPAGGVIHMLAGETMGTTWCVKLADLPSVNTTRLLKRIQGILDRVTAQMSPWREDSDLCRFNRARPGAWMKLPEEFFEVLSYALDVARATNGAFDPTVGPLVNGWGFGPAPRGGSFPDEAEVRWWRKGCGWRRLELDYRERRARQEGGISLDLCAIAKGFAVDLVARDLDRLGWDHYLVEVGGELRGRGVKPDSSPWWVELELPHGAPPQFARSLVALEGASVATSGDYRRYFEARGRRYSHTIDPRSGYPAQNGVVSTTVLARECMAADAWSTALTVLGVETAVPLADRLGLAARFICRDGDHWRLHTTRAYREMLE